MHHLVVGSSGTYVAEPASTLTSGAALQVVGAGAGSTSRSTSPRHAMGGSGGAPPPRGSLSRSSSGSSKRPQSGAGLEQRARYVAQLCQEKPELVKLNIGGTRYTTTKATLTRLEDSFFKALLVPRPLLLGPPPLFLSPPHAPHALHTTHRTQHTCFREGGGKQRKGTPVALTRGMRARARCRTGTFRARWTTRAPTSSTGARPLPPPLHLSRISPVNMRADPLRVRWWCVLCATQGGPLL